MGLMICKKLRRKISNIFRPLHPFPEVVVSLTSYPARINYLQYALDSIFAQTRKPDKVVIWLADSEFVNKEADLPDYLNKLAQKGKVIIEWCRDLKPHKKYFYALQKYRESIVITVDDDLLFEPDMIECLLESYKRFPYAVSAIRTHLMRCCGDKFSAYREFLHQQNFFIGQPSMRLLATNGAGALFPPRLLKLKYFDAEPIEKLCLYTDDLWLKMLEVLSEVPVVQARKYGRLNLVENSQNISLWQRNQQPDGNDLSLENIRKWADEHYGKDYLINKIFYRMPAKIFDLLRKFRGQNTVLYFVPHQDDELLTMGADICAAAARHKNVYVVLCTDGSSSGVRQMLNNRQSCQFHNGTHCYELSKDEFVAARDAEFTESCLALGVKRENICILPQRMPDGALDSGFAEEVIGQYLERFGYGATVCTIYFDTGDEQHRDHKALGAAVHNLKQHGIINKVRFFREPYCDGNNEVQFFCKKVTPEQQPGIRKAIGSYSFWRPEDGRYAVGYHSVPENFDDLQCAMEIYYRKE